MKGERRVGGLLCSEVLADLSEYVDGQLDAARRGAIEAHVAGCDVCARFGGTFGKVVERLRAAGPSSRPPPCDGLLEKLDARIAGGGS